MKIIIPLLYLIVQNYLIAQKNIFFVDSNNNPIKYVYVYDSSSKTKLHSNSNGLVILNSNEKVVYKSVKNGYILRQFITDTLQDNDKIRLSNIDQVVDLGNVEINSKQAVFVNKTINDFDNHIKGFLGLKVNNYDNQVYQQYVANSGIAENSRIKELLINASEKDIILHINFNRKEKDGNYSNLLKVPVIFSLEKKSWNILNLENMGLKIPQHGFYIQYEIFNMNHCENISIEQNVVTQGVLTASEIDEFNIEPLMRFDYKKNEFIPITSLNGLVSPNLSFKLNIAISESKNNKIKEIENSKTISRRKLRRVTKRRSDFKVPAYNKVSYPNDSPKELIRTLSKLMEEENISYLCCNLVHYSNKKDFIEILDLLSTPDFCNGSGNYMKKWLVVADSLCLTEYDSSITKVDIPVSMNFEDINYKLKINLILTQQGWKIDNE